MLDEEIIYGFFGLLTLMMPLIISFVLKIKPLIFINIIGLVVIAYFCITDAGSFATPLAILYSTLMMYSLTIVWVIIFLWRKARRGKEMSKTSNLD